jgi:hypothetical protein
VRLEVGLPAASVRKFTVNSILCKIRTKTQENCYFGLISLKNGAQFPHTTRICVAMLLISPRYCAPQTGGVSGDALREIQPHARIQWDHPWRVGRGRHGAQIRYRKFSHPCCRDPRIEPYVLDAHALQASSARLANHAPMLSDLLAIECEPVQVLIATLVAPVYRAHLHSTDPPVGKCARHRDRDCHSARPCGRLG